MHTRNNPMPAASLRPSVVAIICLTAAASASLAEDWAPTGGPPGGSIRAVATTGGRVLASASGGLFVADGAGPWSLAPVEAGPLNIRHITPAGDHFYLTTISARVFRTDGTAGVEVTSPGSVGVITLDVDRDDLYAIASDVSALYSGNLFFSEDGAAGWTPIETPEEVTDAFKMDDLIIATGASAFNMYRSTDGGESWERIELGVPTLQVFSPGHYIRGGDALFASASSFTAAAAIIRSDDRGATWRLAGAGLDASEVLDLTLHGDQLYAATVARDRARIEVWRARLDQGDWVLRASPAAAGVSPSASLVVHDGALLMAIGGAGSLGVLRSTDGGATWAPAHEGLAASAVVAMGAGGDQILASDSAAGKLWRYDDRAGEWIPSSFPASAGRIREVAPMGAGFWLAAGDTGGIRLSDDGGRSWRPANNGVPTYQSIGGIKLREFNAFAARGSTWIAGGGPGLEWPPPGSGKGSAAVETGGGGVLRSINGAETWQRATAGLPVIGLAGDGSAHYPAAMALAATSDGFVMGTRRHGVYRSVDDGRTWTASSAGLPASGWTGGLAAIVTLAEFDGALYAGSDARDTDATLFRSTDGGATWSAVEASLPHAPALALRAHDGRLFAAMSRILSGPAAGDGAGVWATADGATWAPVGDALAGRPATALAALGDSLIAGTDGLGAWRLDTVCAADLDGDGELTFFDFLMFQNLFAAADPRADFTGDGVLDFFDFLAFQSSFTAGCA
jgi:hypothetical protein